MLWMLQMLITTKRAHRTNIIPMVRHGGGSFMDACPHCSGLSRRKVGGAWPSWDKDYQFYHKMLSAMTSLGLMGRVIRLKWILHFWAPLCVSWPRFHFSWVSKKKKKKKIPHIPWHLREHYSIIAAVRSSRPPRLWARASVHAAKVSLSKTLNLCCLSGAAASLTLISDFPVRKKKRHFGRCCHE